MRRVLMCFLAFLLPVDSLTAVQNTRSTVADRVQALTRDSRWTLAASVPMKFTTHHPQGMVKIGDTLFVSAVEIKVRTRRLEPPAGGYDRDAGEGIGHLFKIDMKGNLLADLALGEGSIYHPGGIDYDGRDIWVPVAEYRPNSRSIVYRVDPGMMKAAEVFRFADHLGGIVHDTDDHALHAVSWGSRRFYRWTLGGDGRVTNAAAAPETLRTRTRRTTWTIRTASTPAASHAVHRRDRDAPDAGCAIPSGSVGSIWSISAMAVRSIKCRSCCGPPAGW